MGKVVFEAVAGFAGEGEVLVVPKTSGVEHRLASSSAVVAAP